MKRLVSVLATLGTLVGLGIGVGGVAASLMGVRFVPVLTGSMSPVAPPGSLVLTTPRAATEVREGDILAFVPPAPYTPADGRPYLHRVTEILDVRGTRAAITKGDANPGPDPWRVVLADETDMGRARLTIPFAGRLLAAGSRSALPYGIALLMFLASIRLRRRAREVPGCTCGPAAAEVTEAPAEVGDSHLDDCDAGVGAHTGSVQASTQSPAAYKSHDRLEPALTVNGARPTRVSSLGVVALCLVFLSIAAPCRSLLRGRR